VIAPPKFPTLYPKQAEAIWSPARYTIIEASTKCGKTAGCLVWLIAMCWKGRQGHNFWWVAPIFPQAKIVFRRIKRMLLKSDPQQKVWEANEGEMWIGLINGARMWFKGADKPDSLYGEDVYGAVIDEASRVKEEAWHAVRSTLTSTGGSLKIIGNVRGRKNWAYRLAQRAKSGQPNMAYFKLTAYDAVDGGVLPLAEVEDAKAILPDHVFRELYLAEPSDDGGNPFGLDAIARATRPVLAAGPVKAYGVDLAKSTDWTVLCGLNGNGEVCELERWQGDWGLTRMRLIQQIGNKPALIDSTGVGDPIVEDLCRACSWVEGFKFSSTSKQQLMEGLAAAFHRSEVAIPTGWLVDECESFEFEYRPGGVRYSAPEGLHDDGVCALALAVRRLTDLRVSNVPLVIDEVVCVN